MEGFVVAGKIVDTYGLKQDLKVEAYLPPKEWKDLKEVFLKRRGGDYVPFELERSKVHGKRWVIIRLKGINSQEEAKKFVGAKLFLQRSQLPKRKEGEYYFFELEGLEVRSSEGKYLGKVSGVVDIKDRVYLEVDGGKVLIPFIKEFILETKPEAGYLVVSSILEDLFLSV